ncbi:hypothetical protein NEIMUCOT_04618 [Neisseria mucosa ATCC 25996]|uniref:Uncharacterized protein n=1 Tax=Neisseria mucosa (strain ATCC 25996 / DSM 4631 / NCTC 10774 / M26) TaxID=546266 RepID=D2ZVH5_NEIM2|nr:hypothetical protein NEIMUCOT_04618 [Neisseria mucosa ATCC 25996]
MLLIMPYFNSKGRLKRVSDDLLLFFALFGVYQAGGGIRGNETIVD